ncbi:S41 family peptidase [Microbulbifer sp. EKSA008]|uniref:S41 family peptidase n=1 Tax=Microbulbifer sp. EKSA008 TaxID=3243367 RepID=UPI004041F16B
MKRQLKMSLAVLISFFSMSLAASSGAMSSCQFETGPVIKAAAVAIQKHYILEEKGQALSAQLNSLAESKHFNHLCSDYQQLASALTKEIRTLSGDKHFYIEHIDNQKEAHNWIEQWQAEAPSNNYGVKKIEILPGNIGYLSLSSFHTYKNAHQTLAAAFTLLRHSEGLILDLRSNGGGDEETANAVLQSFIDPHSPFPFVIESRKGREIPKRISPQPWPSYGSDRPMVILIDGRSFSASESTAFSLQQLGRATVIGTASAGGAHMMESPQSLPYGFEIGIPDKRPVSTIVGSRPNWEGQGVIPDIEAGQQEIIQIALKVVAEAL